MTLLRTSHTVCYVLRRFLEGWAGGGGPLSLNPLPAPVSAEGITDTEMLIFDGRVAKYGPGQKKESFCPIPGNNSIFAGRRFVCTRSDFLSFGSFFFKFRFPIPRDMAPKCWKGCQILRSRNSRSRKITQDHASLEMAQAPQPGASHPHAPGVQMT